MDVFFTLTLGIYIAISIFNPELFNLWLLGIIFVLFCIFTYIELDKEEKRQIDFINNKEIFNEI